LAQFRTTLDIVDSVLSRCGEVTNGNSAYESRALEFVNRIHRSIVAGGLEFNVDMDEIWVWARSQYPIILELKPKYNTGTVSLVKGSEAGSFSASVTDSVQGWHLQLDGRDGIYKIVTHAAGGTAFELDGAYDGDTGATLTYKAFKLDYDLVPTYLIIDSTNNKLDFKTSAGGSILTATLTAGSYTPSQLATHVATQMTTIAAGPTITGSYSTITRKFTLSTNSAGATTLIPQFASGTNYYVSAHRLLGFDDEDVAAATIHVSTYILGGIAKFIEPMTIHRGDFYRPNEVFGLDKARFKKDYSINRVEEGYPDNFCKIVESQDGMITVRFNKYPIVTTRVEVDWIPIPRDLKDNATSIPLIPRKFIDVLEYGASSDLMFEKEDTKADGFAQRTTTKLQAMMVQNRNELQKIGDHFGQVIARQDLYNYARRKLIYGVPGDQ